MHPTAFIDQKKPDAGVKTLCAEVIAAAALGSCVSAVWQILRGSGAVLVGPDGERFVNELEKRDYVREYCCAQLTFNR